jgi:hypothetical protein
MRFKEYLQELDLSGVEDAQAEKAHEPTGEASSQITNPKIRMEINYRLTNELYGPFLSPEGGIQSIRKVLHRYGFDMPALYDADPEGDEIAFEIEQFGQDNLATNIYILYYLTDEGHYEFFAEVGDDARMDELLSDGEEEDEEEQV